MVRVRGGAGQALGKDVNVGYAAEANAGTAGVWAGGELGGNIGGYEFSTKKAIGWKRGEGVFVIDENRNIPGLPSGGYRVGGKIYSSQEEHIQEQKNQIMEQVWNEYCEERERRNREKILEEQKRSEEDDFLGTLVSPIRQYVEIKQNEKNFGMAVTDADRDHILAQRRQLEAAERRNMIEDQLIELYSDPNADQEKIGRLERLWYSAEGQRLGAALDYDIAEVRHQIDQQQLQESSKMWYFVPVIGGGYALANAYMGENAITGEDYSTGQGFLQVGYGVANLGVSAAGIYGATHPMQVLASKPVMLMVTNPEATIVTGMAGTGIALDTVPGAVKCASEGCTTEELVGIGGRGLTYTVAGYQGISDLRSSGNYTVYQGVDEAGKVRYIGMTKRDPQIRFSEHLGSTGTGKEVLTYEPISSNLTQLQARLMEQNLINQYGLSKDGGQLLNKINSISPSK